VETFDHSFKEISKRLIIHKEISYLLHVLVHRPRIVDYNFESKHVNTHIEVLLEDCISLVVGNLDQLIMQLLVLLSPHPLEADLFHDLNLLLELELKEVESHLVDVFAISPLAADVGYRVRVFENSVLESDCHHGLSHELQESLLRLFFEFVLPHESTEVE
jgi:hypothetical protein